MPPGGLLTGTVESVLLDLAGKSATGCLLVRDQEADEAEVFLRDGQVYAVSVPGRRTMLGVRLMSSGALTPEALAEALEIQRTELQGWRLGELLVHLGYVDLAVVEQVVVEHLKDALADLLGWPVAAWKFCKGKRTRQDIAPPTPVEDLLDGLRDRATTWDTISEAIGGPAAIPWLSSGAPPDSVTLGPNEWALMCKVDGERSVADLASDCGFTLFEAGQVVMNLVAADVLEVEQPAELVLPVVTIEQADREEAERAERLATERAEAEQAEAERLAAEQAEAERVAAEQAEAERLAAEQAEAERAEAERLAAEQAEAERAEAERRRLAIEEKRLQEAELLHLELEALAAKEAASREERRRVREAARAEEAAHEARVREQAARAAVEEDAWADHATWLSAARAGAETEAWAAHRDWLDAERAACEHDAWADHEVVLAAEAAAQADQEAIDAAERETAERETAEREAAEREAVEAAAQREAAEQEAAEREAVERELAAEAQRRDQAAAEQAVREEAEQIARDEAGRVEQEEAERLELEEAERLEQAELLRRAEEDAARRIEEDTARGDESLRAAEAASLLTSLNRDMPLGADAHAKPEPEPEREPEPEVYVPEPASDGPAPMVARDHADTAMLLRELSSLGFSDDDNRPASPPPRTPRPAPQAANSDKNKKRKGLFGRG